MENQNNKTKFIRQNKLVWDKVRDKRYIYSIPNPTNIYKTGFCNFRCNSQYMIDSIELNINHKCIAIIHNHDGLVFQKLRDILKISDETIIPCLGNNNFIPFFNNCNVRLFVDVNNLVIRDRMDGIFTYDDVEIDDNIVPLYQCIHDSTNFYSNIMTNIMYMFRYITDIISFKSNKVMTNFKFNVSTVDFTGAEAYFSDQINITGAKYKLNFSDNVNTILVYTPNNKVIKQYLTANGYLIHTISDIQNQFTIIKLKNNLNKNDCKILHISLENSVNQPVYIYGIRSTMLKINNGIIESVK